MNCTLLQRRLLALEDPRRPPAEWREHLAHCAACRAWQRRIVEVEARLPLLPVPATAAKARLIERVLAGAAGSEREKLAPRSTLPLRRPRRPDFAVRAKVALPPALAAGLLMFAIIVFGQQWQRRPAPGPAGVASRDVLLGKVFEHDLKLAGWSELPERMRELADLAGDLQEQAGPLASAGSADDLDALVRWYGQVVRKGVVPLAGDAPPDDRDAVAGRLQEAREKTLKLAQQVSEDRARSLEALAKAAEEARASLRGEAPRTLRRATQPGRWQPALVGRPAGQGILPASIPAVLLAGIARGSTSTDSASPAEQARRFSRNRSLLEKLVQGGVSLAREKNPVERARCCNGLAESLADEMQKAAGAREGARVAELGDHLLSLLKRGVADNLGDARAHIPAGSAEEPELEKVKSLTESFMNSLEADLQGADDVAEVPTTRDRIRTWKESVEKALHRAPAGPK
jgi:hypothetical protein